MNKPLRLLAALLPLAFRAIAAETPAPLAPEEIGRDEAGQAAPAVEPLSLDIPAAVELAFRNNPSFRIERISPSIARANEQTERAAFDPVLGGEAGRTLSETRGHAATSRPATDGTHSDRGTLGLSETLPTGTTLALESEAARAAGDSGRGRSDRRSLGADLTVTQSLLRGFGTGPNLARLRAARIDVELSLEELRAAAELLAAQTEQACLEVTLAERRIGIQRDSLSLAEAQKTEIDERIRVGALAESERAAAEAEVAARREGLINAEATLAKARLALVRLVSPLDPAAWSRPFRLQTGEEDAGGEVDDVEDHARLALEKRPDLRQARLEIRRGGLDVVRTRNGLLPKLDFFIRLGSSRYADAFSGAIDEEGRGREAEAGVRLEQALGARAEKAAHKQALASVRQAEEALRNAENLAQLEVRTAHVEIGRSSAQIDAARATRHLREETLRLEMEKFRAGRSTELLVVQAQRDLLVSRLTQAEAETSRQKALVDLYRAEGTLLERRGLAVEE